MTGPSIFIFLCIDVQILISLRLNIFADFYYLHLKNIVKQLFYNLCLSITISEIFLGLFLVLCSCCFLLRVTYFLVVNDFGLLAAHFPWKFIFQGILWELREKASSRKDWHLLLSLRYRRYCISRTGLNN